MSSRENELSLIEACLAPNSAFEGKFREWESGADIANLDYGALRLLPFLTKRLSDLGIESVLELDLKRIQRYFWAKRKLQDATITESIVPLMKGIKPVSLKGFALEQLVYKEGELRPFSDLDLLVSRSDFRLVSQRSPNHDLRFLGPAAARSYAYLQHAMPYKGKNLDLDLHWTFFPLGLDVGYDNRIRERSSKCEKYQGWLVPSTTDALIHTLLHGRRPDVVSPVRWLLDAHLLVTRNEVDWNLFQQEARNLGLQREIQAGLRELQEVSTPDSGIPVLRVRGTAGFHLSHYAARKAVNSNSMWLKRFARLAGSDSILIRRALAGEGHRLTAVRVATSTLRESVIEICSLINRGGLKRLVTGKWSDVS